MPDERIERLASLRGGFRERLLPYEELTAQVRAWADAFPDVVRLESLTRTPGGREQWLLRIGPDPERTRPAVWVDGNMHASELCGSSVALAIAEDAIRAHLGASLEGLPPHVNDVLREVLFYVVPRIAPDGAEAVLNEGRFVRSVPRNERTDRLRARWRSEDVDGDGLSLLMRVRDDAGEFVDSVEHPGLLFQRTLDDPPPYYKVYPEGVIDGWDGRTVPDPHYLDDNGPDLNRNFPWSWGPEAEQVGAGPFPGSEPESRAIMDFASAHPEICAWLNLHCFGGVFIRPRGDVPDIKMDPSDLALYQQLGAWAEQIVGYPMVSGFEEFTYSPEVPIRGDLAEWAYSHRGAVAYVCELWDFFDRLGVERTKRFVDRYGRLGREHLLRFAKWDRDENAGRALRPWKRVEHPQLGEVEVGGLDPRVGVWNPPLDEIDEVCTKQSAMWMRVAALVPRVRLDAEAVELAGDARVVRVRVRNLGYLPTYILSSAKPHAHNEPIFVEATATGCSLVSSAARVEVGHLDGWGRGLHDESGAVHFMRSRGSSASRSAEWTVRGRGTLTVRAGSSRVGWVETSIAID